jgi:hypothetical protein
MVKNNRVLAQGYFIPSGTAFKNVELVRPPVYIERKNNSFDCGPFELAGSVTNGQRKQIESGRFTTEIVSDNNFVSPVRRRNSASATVVDKTAKSLDKNGINSTKPPKNRSLIDSTQSERGRSEILKVATKTVSQKSATTAKNTRGVNSIDKVRQNGARLKEASNKHVVNTAPLASSSNRHKQGVSIKADTNLEASTSSALDASPQRSSSGTAAQYHSDKGDADLTLPIEPPPFFTKKSSLSPDVSSAFCDRCSITFGVPNSDPEGTHFKAKDLAAAMKGGDYTLRRVPPSAKKTYGFNYKLVESKGGQVALIQFSPKNDTAHFWRIELNPREIGSEGMGQVKLVLKGLVGPDFRDYLADGNLTRLDASLDIDKLRPDDVMIVSNRARSSSLWQRSFTRNGLETWVTETSCLGSPASDYFATVYDKAAQLWRVKGASLTNLRTRIEVRINPRGKDGRAILVKDILQINNPFAVIGVAYYPAPDDDDPWFEFFVHASRHFGQEEALRKIKDRATRSLYRLKLLENEPDWWQPEKLWAEFLSDLKATGLFSGDVFQHAEKAVP